ncbi:hypothetical protein [Chryseobacterium shigense]|uniref:hypothetical protein n=1 Tax=Chryseobacterium shigense TaxID=297244 RepID=UPI0013FDABA5|nr:hypothetical protein [Chryseobacterium shigense]
MAKRLTADQKKEALDNYKKSLKQNPENKNVKKILTKSKQLMTKLLKDKTTLTKVDY